MAEDYISNQDQGQKLGIQNQGQEKGLGTQQEQVQGQGRWCLSSRHPKDEDKSSRMHQ